VKKRSVNNTQQRHSVATTQEDDNSESYKHINIYTVQQQTQTKTEKKKYRIISEVARETSVSQRKTWQKMTGDDLKIFP
jgi:hypothetical protein